MRHTSKSFRRLKTGLIVVLTISSAVLLTRTAVEAFRPHLYAGTILRGDQPAPDMEGMQYSTGEPVELSSLEGHVLLVYFGYTNCPDVCPAALSTAAQAISKLNDSDRSRSNALMISVDPERDDPESLREYVQSFDPRFRSASGDTPDLDRVASTYGVYYALGEGSIEEGYVVDHTGSLLGIGPNGSLRIVWSPDVTGDALARDIAELLG